MAMLCPPLSTEKSVKIHNVNLRIDDLYSSFEPRISISGDKILFIEITAEQCHECDLKINPNNIKSENILAIYYPYISMSILRQIHEFDLNDKVPPGGKWVGVIVLAVLCESHTEERQSEYEYCDAEEKTFVTELAECDSYPCDTIESLYHVMIDNHGTIINEKIFDKIQKIISSTVPLKCGSVQ
jgi:hypothetical protein